MMAKTRKCLDIDVEGLHYVCIQEFTNRDNPFALYKQTLEYNKYGYLTYHRRLVERYADFYSVLCLLKLIYDPSVQSAFKEVL